MNNEPARVATKVAAAMRVPTYSHVYAVLPARGPVTFHSQQRRAFNLVWALAETGEIPAGGADVGIVGGGLAGMTAAAAASLLGCKVIVFEADSLPFHQQRGNGTRYIHPNILDWPHPWALKPKTDLPHMNWEANTCKNVIHSVDEQWKQFSNIEMKSSTRVTQIKETENEIRVTSAPYNQFPFHCAIVCVGFGKEKPFQQLQGPTYWEDESLHQFKFEYGMQALITGIGDGGLIDLMRLAIDDFDHRNIWETVARHPPLQDLASKLVEAETAARNARDTDEGGAQLTAAYKDLHLDKVVPQSIRDSLKPNVKVILNGLGETPFALTASILNRVIAYAIIQWAEIEYIDGRLSLTEKKAEQRFLATFDRQAEPKQYTVDKIVVRHGPSGGAFASVFSKEIADKFLKPTQIMADAGTKQYWPDDYFDSKKVASARQKAVITGDTDPDILTPERGIALGRLNLRFRVPLKQRFYANLNVDILHRLEKVGKFEIVRQDCRYRIRVAPGPKERFCLRTVANKRIVRLTKDGRLPRAAYSLESFTIGGQQLDPIVIEDECFLCQALLPEDEVDIEYRYTILEMTDGVYEITTHRFTKNFTLQLMGEPKLEYEVAPQGGFPDLRLNAWGPILKGEVNELSFPYQGYLIQWYPRSVDLRG